MKKNVEDYKVRDWQTVVWRPNLITTTWCANSLTATQPCPLTYTSLRLFSGEGSGTPLQSSCLENPMDGEAWWAAVHGVAKSRTRLSDFTLTFHFHALGKQMATHSSVLAWRIPGTRHLQLRQETQGSSDFRLRSQGPCRLGTGESGLVLG